MSFFGKSLSSRKIKIDAESTNSASPEMVKRLDRIESNYSKLAEILLELEAKFELDDRLATVAENDVMESDNLPTKPR